MRSQILLRCWGIFSLALVISIFVLVALRISTKAQQVVTAGGKIGVVEVGVGDRPGGRGESGEWRYVVYIEQVLEHVRIDFEPVKDLSALDSYHLLLFPYNKHLTEDQVQALQDYMDRGGRTVWFYLCPKSLADNLGVSLRDPVGDPDRRKFKQVRFDTKVLPGAPATMFQDSWSIQAIEPSRGGKVFGVWQDAQGREVGYPAGTLGEKGAFFTHVLLNDDLTQKGRFLLALVGQYLPSVWDKAAARSMADFGKVGRYGTIEELRAEVIRKGVPAVALEESLRLHQQAKQLRETKRYPDAIDRLAQAQSQLESAYYPLFSSKSPELRGVWCSAYGSPNWPEMARTLRGNGFNAIFPFVGSAGLAYFPNKHLPVSEGVKQGRDPLKECVRVAHEAGLQVHAWFIAWYLHLATRETLNAMRNQDRLQVDAAGGTTNWLCPSRPENLSMVREALVDLARNYDLDGIHFDYLRFPDKHYCFCNHCKEQFQKDAGVTVTNFVEEVTTGRYQSEFESWRREQVTRLVREVASGARQARPGIKISAAVFGGFSSARRSQAQDAMDWATRGYVDFLCPMNYTNDLQKLEKLTAEQKNAINGKVPLIAGLGVFSDSSYFDSPVMLVDQIDRVRQAGADGFLLFKYNSEMAQRFLPALRLGITKTEAVVPGSLPP
ncbi:MAG: family 10 glycosylhydrolase [Armatimonadetes bacterium]|nr:family 10 glycosylhydrolase [Armatimonadota bacterium]